MGHGKLLFKFWTGLFDDNPPLTELEIHLLHAISSTLVAVVCLAGTRRIDKSASFILVAGIAYVDLVEKFGFLIASAIVVGGGWIVSTTVSKSKEI